MPLSYHMDVIDLLRQLIAINSSPPEAKAPGVGGEGPLADYVGRFLVANGFRVETHEIVPGRPNLIALPREYLPDRPLLVLEAHLDTVGVENMVVDPFQAKIKDGRMFGRGACDTKGTMAAMLAALVEVTSSTDLHFNVGFVGTAHEEGGGLGARHLVEAGFKADAVLVGEPTSLQPVIAHKGLLRFAITTQGRACHSSRPQQGENAIDRMWAVQADLYQRFEPFWQALSPQGGNTLSLNTIHGGSFINIVPDRCRIEVDARYEPDTDTDKALSELKAVLLNHSKSRLEVLHCLPSFATPEHSTLLAALESALQAHGIRPHRKSEPWFSDAAFFARAGCDTVVWGAGEIAHAHTADESIEVEQLLQATEILKTLLLTLNKPHEFQGWQR